METAQISSIVATIITAILTYLNWRTTNRKSNAESGKIQAESQVTLGDGWVKLVNELQEQLDKQHGQILQLVTESEKWKLERQSMLAKLDENQREIDELTSVLGIVRDRVSKLEAENEQLRQENGRLKARGNRL